MYLDSLWVFAKPEARRALLIELAFEAQDIRELLVDWLWENDRGSEVALQAHLLFQLDYASLGEIFNLGFKEATQLVRTQRNERLGSMLTRADTDEGGISCFLVEQLLSPWIDSEWDNLNEVDKMRLHLDRCPSCRPRLEAYRNLNHEILQSRQIQEPVSESEWSHVLRTVFRDRRRRRWRTILVVLLTILLFGGLVFYLSSGPEEMPNIYEINE